MNTLHYTGNKTLTSRHYNRPYIYDARYLENGKKKPVIIFVHGFKGFKDWGTFNLVADAFARHEFIFVKVNLSHNGTTPEHPLDFVDLEAFGNNNFCIELDDLDLLINELTGTQSPLSAEEVDINKIGMIGHSRGGGLVLLKAAEETRIKAVVTWAAINNLEERWPQSFLDDWKEKGVVHIENGRTNQQMPLYYQLVDNFLKNKERLDIPSALKNMEQPLLVIHGTGDETLPHHMASDIAYRKEGAELLMIPDSDHTFGSAHPWSAHELPSDTAQVVKASIEFFKKRLAEKSLLR